MTTHKFRWFDAPEAYADYLSAMPSEYKNLYDEHGDSWLGGPWEQCLNNLMVGDTTNLVAAQSLVDKMRDENLFSMGQPELVSGIVGFCPNVPNALMGAPYDMFNVVQSENESILSPIKIFVETTVSAGLTNSELVNRGVAVMAFALAMSMVRPIELYAASFGHIESKSCEQVCGAIVRIPTSPLDLERATFMLTAPGYCRRLAFPAMNYQQGLCREQSIPFPRDRRDLCMCEPHDVLIQGGHLYDTLMLTNPVQWVKNMIAKHRGDVSETH